MQLKINIEPVAKGRPRFTRNGRTYTPQKTRDYERRVRGAFLEANKETMPVYPRDVALEVEAVFAKSVPKSYTKKIRELCLSGKMQPTVKADLDNYLKAVLDAINGLAFEDDAQIVRIKSEKIYAEEPYVEIKIRSLK